MNYMLDRLVDGQLNVVKEYSKEYEDSLVASVERQIAYSGFEKRFQGKQINLKKLRKTSKVNTLYTSFDSYLKLNKNIVVSCESFKHSPFIAALVFEKTIQDCLKNEEHIPKMLYVDTFTLLNDYGNQITCSKAGEVFTPLTNKDIFEKEIFNADFVFWDKFNYNKAGYAVNKLYSILSIRYAKCLNNLFFINTDFTSYSEHTEIELVNVMGIPDDSISLSIVADEDNIAYIE